MISTSLNGYNVDDNDIDRDTARGWGNGASSKSTSVYKETTCKYSGEDRYWIGIQKDCNERNGVCKGCRYSRK
jgi:hypothetical protein